MSATPASPRPGMRSEGRWAIVRRQFARNRAAVWGLRVTFLLILVAIYAPAIACGIPFVQEAADGQRTWPWFERLFDKGAWPQALDRIFNLAMVAVTLYAAGAFLLRVLAWVARWPWPRVRRSWRRGVLVLGALAALLHLTEVGFTKGKPLLSWSRPHRSFSEPYVRYKRAEDVERALEPWARLEETLEGNPQTAAAALALLPDLEARAKEVRALQSRIATRIARLPDRAVEELKKVGMDLLLGSRAILAQAAALSGASGAEGESQGDGPGLSTGARKALAALEGAVSAAPPRPQTVVAALEGLRGQEAAGPGFGRVAEKAAQMLAEADRRVVAVMSRMDRDLRSVRAEEFQDVAQEKAAARRAWEETRAVFPLIPYSHQDQRPDPYDVYRSYLDFSRGERHVLGTDREGHDVLAWILYGTRISLTIGLVAVGIYVTIGTILGALAGYLGGKVDLVIMRIVETVICIPGLFLILTIVALFEKRSIFLIMFAIGVVAWTGVTRLVRGEVLRERHKEYVLTARAMGFSTVRIIFRHVLPNSLAPVLVTAAFGVAGAIVIESGLSFLGLGDPTVPSWGGLLNEGRKIQYWHLIIPPSVAIFITVTALNLVGDGVRDALDPRLRD